MPRNGRSASSHPRMASTNPPAAQAVHRGCGGADAGHDQEVRLPDVARASDARWTVAPETVSACSMETRLPAP